MEEYEIPVDDIFHHQEHGWIMVIDFDGNHNLLWEFCSKEMVGADSLCGTMDKTLILNKEQIKVTGYEKFHKFFGGYNHLKYGFKFDYINGQHVVK